MQALKPTQALMFSSRIRFVDFRENSKTVRNMSDFITEEPNHWSGNLGVFSEAYTDGIYMCNAGGVTDAQGKQFAFFHFYPEDDIPTNIDRLRQEIRELKRQNPKLRGFLQGGQDFDPNSKRLYTALCALFRAEKIPFSTVWGHQNGNINSNISYAGDTDTWTVNTRLPGQGSVESLEALKQAFQKIDIAPGDELEIGGRVYKGSALKKSSSN